MPERASGNGHRVILDSHGRPIPPAALDAAMRSASVLTERMRFAGQVGSDSFNGLRNVDTALGRLAKLTPENYRKEYARGGIAKRIVDSYPIETWRGGAFLQEDPDPELDTEFELQWQAFANRLNVWTLLKKADVLTGLGRFGVLLIGDGTPLNTELARMSGQDKVLYLKPLSERNVKIAKYDENVTSPRYGLPTEYQMQGKAGERSLSEKVHHSRVIHIVDTPLDDPNFGAPRLEAVWNYLDDLKKVVGMGAEAFWNRAFPGMHMSLPKDVEMTDGLKQKLQDNIDDYEHGVERWLRTRGGIEIEQLTSDVAAIGPAASPILDLIASATGIPKRLLMGSERGELASSQDRENWNDRIKDRRDDFAEPVVRALVMRLQEIGALPPAETYTIVWPEMESLSEKEKAEVAGLWADVNTKQVQSGQPPARTSNEIRESNGWAPIEEVFDVDSLMTDDAMLRANATTADVDADEPGWVAIHRAADRNRAAFQRLFQAALDEMPGALDIDELEAVIARQAEDGAELIAETAIAPLVDRQDELAELLHTTLTAGGKAAGKLSAKRGSFLASGMRAAQDEPISFDLETTNPRAVEWAELRSATLVQGASDELQTAIRNIIAQAFDEGLTPRQAAQRIKPLVSLTARQAQAVTTLDAALRDPDNHGSVVYAGKTKIRIPEGGLSEDRIATLTDRYRNKLLRQRSMLIARTESIFAANEGQMELWRQAVDRGDLTGREGVEWIATPDDRQCDRCAALNGKIVILGGEFADEVGGVTAQLPPLHPSCRCAVGLAPPEAVDQELADAA